MAKERGHNYLDFVKIIGKIRLKLSNDTGLSIPYENGTENRRRCPWLLAVKFLRLIFTLCMLNPSIHKGLILISARIMTKPSYELNGLFHVNTGDMVAGGGAYDRILENPVIKAFAGDIGLDIYSIKGFLCMELFSSLTIYIIIYFIIQYAGAFSSEVENKTIDIILSTPMSRRRFFISRYLSWVGMNLVMIVSWIIFIYAGVLVLESVFGFGEADVSLGDVVRAMILFLPFLLSAQGFCMLTSVMTNNSKKAYGISFGIYFGMYFFHILVQLGEKLDFMKYFTIFHYWDYKSIFVDGVVLWGHIAFLIIISAVLFIAEAVVFERKDL